MSNTKHQSKIEVWKNQKTFPGTTAISLHAHTSCSKESLALIPYYANRLPIVAPIFRNAMDQYTARSGESFDFSKLFWTPPLPPAEVVAGEERQIGRRLDRPALIALSDHDNIEAREFLPANMREICPVSLEWTLYEPDTEFHLGIYNLPPGQAASLSEAMGELTRKPDPAALTGLLSELQGFPETLIVLNHPFWSARELGRAHQRDCVLSWLSRYRPYIHALEINGYRPWSENRMTRELAGECNLPLVSGGDRHGCEPNTTINLSPWPGFPEFAEAIRSGWSPGILFFPEYSESVRIRQLRLAGEVIRNFPPAVREKAHWTERIYFRSRSGLVHPVSRYWNQAGLGWVEHILTLIRLLGNRWLSSALRLAFGGEAGLS